MKKRIALLSLAAIFAFATIATADNSNKKAAEPTKKEVKSEKKEGCCNEGAQKGDCKGEKNPTAKEKKKVTAKLKNKVAARKKNNFIATTNMQTLLTIKTGRVSYFL